MAITVRELITKWGFDFDDRPLKQMESGISNIKGAATSLGLALAGVTGAVAAFAYAAGGMEQTQIAFETMLGSAEKATGTLTALKEFAKTTPFELKDVLEGSKRLLAYNVEAENLIPTMQALGNIAAGVGMEKMPQLILAFGQVKAATKLTGAELRQFSEAGVPMISALAAKFGVAESAIQKMVSEGRVGFKDVEAALFSLTSGNGRFADLMVKQSKSFLGMVSNIKDMLYLMAVQIGDSVLPQLKLLAAEFVDLIKANEGLIAEGLVQFLKTCVTTAKALVGVTTNLISAFRGFAGIVGGVNNALKIALGLMVAMIGIKMLTGIGQITIAMWQMAAQTIAAFRAMAAAAITFQLSALAMPLAIGAAIVAIGLIIEDLIAYFNGDDSVAGLIVEGFSDAFAAVLKKLFGFLQSMSDYVVGWVSQLGTWISAALKPIEEFFSKFSNSVFKLFGFAGTVGAKLGSVPSTISQAMGVSPGTAPALGGSSVSTSQNNSVPINMTVNVGKDADVNQVRTSVKGGIDDAIAPLLRSTARSYQGAGGY